MSAPRRSVIAGNWKMHKGPSEAAAFLDRFLPLLPAEEDRTVILFPPAVSLGAAEERLLGRPDVELGAQHVHWEERGAFTGEVSAEIAADAGARYALIGHSERRHLFGESVEETVRKVRAARRAGLVPVLCVGETIEERRAGRAEAVVEAQLRPVLDAAGGGELLVAYEPVWAIGTGETASPRDASDMHRFVRSVLSGALGEDRARAVPILYGGSVKPDNAEELLGAPEVDGVLVGGASLDPEGFARICASGR